jgi:hypothetical protein
MPLYRLGFECSPSKIFGEKENIKIKNIPKLGDSKILVGRNNLQILCKIFSIFLRILYQKYSSNIMSDSSASLVTFANFSSK